MSANLVLADSSLIRRPAVHSASTEQARSRRRECSLPIDLYLSIKGNNRVLLLHLPRRLAAGSHHFEHFAPVCGVLGFILLPSDIVDLRHKPSLPNVGS